MKNPYKRGKVHPSPPPPLPDHFLSLLPAVILSLTATLSPDDRQVLAYLVSCCPNAASHRRDDDHVPDFGCDCFRCYMSYWVRWDASPNRQLIHEIIEAYEEDQLLDNKKGNNKNKKKVVKKKGKNPGPGDSTMSSSSSSSGSSGDGAVVVVEPASSSSFSPGKEEDDEDGGVDQLVAGVPDEENKGNARKVVGFLGEKIWGFWN